MKQLFIILILMTTPTLSQAQGPIVVSGYGTGESQIAFERKGADALFIQERARIACHRNSNVFRIRLTEESAEKMDSDTIGVVYVNNAAIISPPYSPDESITLEIFPIDADNPDAARLSAYYKIPIYFCKYYEHRDPVEQEWMDTYKGFERDIIRFFENPPVGDTISSSVLHMIKVRADSRYTELLVKSLTNDDEVMVEYQGHDHSYSPYGESKSIVTHEPVRISDFARERLEWIFKSYEGWKFDYPAKNASAQEWQTWLDDLLKGAER